MPRPNAFESFINHTEPSSGMPAAVNTATDAERSVRAAAPVVPLAAAVEAPFVIEAGLTFATAATAGSLNCTSRNCDMPAIISSRTSASADGLESLTSSSVNTMMPAAFAKPSVTVE